MAFRRPFRRVAGRPFTLIKVLHGPVDKRIFTVCNF